MSSQLVYIVKPRSFSSVEEVVAIFDDRQRGEEFMNRFKTKTDLEIVEQVLNPNFFSDKDRNPYYVSLEKNNLEPRDVFISDLISQADAALEEEYNIDFYHTDPNDEGLFTVMLFAENETAAVLKAIQLRKTVVDSGEWEQALHNHQLKISQLAL